MTPIKDALEKIAPAVEQLACHQTQLDQDGVMVGVSRQAIDEVVNAINEIAISITTPAPGRDALRERIIASIRDVFGLLEMGGSNEPSYLTDAIAHFRDDDDIGPALEMISSAAESCADAILSALPVAPVVDEAGIRAKRTGIYIASKTKHADRWRLLRSDGVPIISTWIDEAGVGETADFHDLWSRCLTESASCSVLVSYREPGEVLKGGWVEIGAALANGIPVYAVGLEEFTIAGYRGITHFATIEEAIAQAIRAGGGER